LHSGTESITAREGTLSRCGQDSKQELLDTDWLAKLSYITISKPKRKFVLIRLQLFNLVNRQEQGEFTVMSQRTN
jgi:hypothetical protein